jgi:hypothetical protein
MLKASLSVLSLLAVCGSLSAEVGPTPGTQPVGPVYQTSDLVCNCVVTSTQAQSEERVQAEGNPVFQRHRIAKVDVQAAYKSRGSTDGGIFVEYDNDSLQDGERAILFLKSDGQSVYVLADPSLGATPFSVLPKPPAARGLKGLESTLATVTQRAVRDDQVNAMRLLQGLDTLDAATLSALTPLTSSKDPEIAFSAMAVLLKRRSLEDIERLKDYLRDYSSDSPPIQVVSIGTELSQIRDERALPDLEALASSRLISVRMGSMQAMRAMKNPQAAPAMVKRLDDSDGYIQYLAVISLAETFGKYEDSWWVTEGQLKQAAN